MTLSGAIWRWLLLCCLGAGLARAQTTNTFLNFETAPVHPVAISPDGSLVAVCNLPDGRVELFNLRSENLSLRASIPVGIDPVSVRFRTDSELWIVNHISDSIMVADASTSRILSVISTRDGPADVVFAGDPQRAFVSCPSENVVLVYNPDTRALVATIPIQGERPKAMAVSPDGAKIYVAIFESGNRTTILAPRVTNLSHVPPAGPADLPIGPYEGANPPPLLDASIPPDLAEALSSSNSAPRVSLIVKQDPAGKWLDDNGRDWTEFVSGTNAPFSGRPRGWRMLDNDVAVINANSFEVNYIEGLMNICMALAVNPDNGILAVVGTDGLNHLRFEPVLQSIFGRVILGLVPPASEPIVSDLNPHLDYQTRQLPLEQRKASIGDPRGAVWNAVGTRLFVTGMGSDNLVALDQQGKRVAAPAALPEGPTGLAFDQAHNRLLLLNRFAASVSLLDAETLQILQTIPLHDPTPPEIRAGRKHFYGTHKTSGLGQTACAFCHVDGRMDRLAWDLGNPLGQMKHLTNVHNFGGVPPALTNNFHPMKGPMVTQTLQDIIGHEPFHWRGDRDNIEEFNPTFEELQGSEELTDAEMAEFRSFLATLHFPPNRFRQFDNTLPRNLPLTNHFALGRGSLSKGAPLPNGDALAGLTFFQSRTGTCSQCHSMPSGVGPDAFFSNRLWQNIAIGPKDEHHTALSSTERSDELPFKIAHLRNLPDKIGMNFEGVSRSGFGFFHDGRVDTLTRFIQDSFLLFNDKQTADLIAFLLCFSGSDLPMQFTPNTADIVPPSFSRDAPAALGKQTPFAQSIQLNNLISRAQAASGRVELVVKGFLTNQWRGWLFVQSGYLPDSGTTPVSSQSLLGLSLQHGPFWATLVPKGSGRRLAIDRDLDGHLDFDEITAGTDPADPASRPAAQEFRILSVAPQQSGAGELQIVWRGTAGERYRFQFKEHFAAAWQPLGGPELQASGNLTTNLILTAAHPYRFYRIQKIQE